MIATVQFGPNTVKYHTPNPITVNRVKSIWRKEPLTIKWLYTIDRDTVFLDVGANVGMYTMLAAAQGAQVYSLEAEAKNYALLKKNCELNHNSVQAFHLGAWDHTGESEIYIHKQGVGAALHSVGESVDWNLQPKQSRETQTVPVTRLDDFCDQHRIEPTHIKIDVDGMEHRVVGGAEHTLRHCEQILIELNCRLSEHRDLIPHIERLGFLLKERSLRTEGTFQNCGEHLFVRRGRQVK